jgi:hypothetical protein
MGGRLPRAGNLEMSFGRFSCRGNERRNRASASEATIAEFSSWQELASGKSAGMVEILGKDYGFINLVAISEDPKAADAIAKKIVIGKWIAFTQDKGDWQKAAYDAGLFK